MNKKIISIFFIILCATILTSCSKKTTSNKQPDFPKINQYWVVDPDGYLDKQVILDSDKVLEKLRLDEIAEVAILVQKGINNNGPFDDEKIWAMNWGREIKLGSLENQRAIVWLIRPDVKPEENRVTIEISTHLTWFTAGDYGPIIEEASDYANNNDFNGTVDSITRNTDEALRRIWKEKGK